MKDYNVIIENLTEGIITNLEEAYDYGYKQGYEDGRNNTEYMVSSAYKHGMEESWEAAKKIARMDTETSENVTGYFGLFRIMDNLTAAEAIEKVKAYEQKQDAEQEQQDRIRVGDEVITEFGYRGIVITDVPCKEGNISVWSPTCTHVQMYPVKKLTKTGRHFDQIAEVLEKMRGESEWIKNGR